MRRSVYGIGFLCAAVLLSLGFSASYSLGERTGRARAQSVREAAEKDSLLPANADGEASPAAESASYVAKDLDGRVVIYRGDGTTLYEYTDIPLTLLPEEVRREVEAGKRFAGIAELYGFLENYSS